MVVDDSRHSNDIGKPTTSRVSSKDMLLRVSRGMVISSSDQDIDDVQLFEGDMSTRIEDGFPYVHFSDRVHQILYQGMSCIVIVKLLGRKIGFQALSNKIYHL